MLLFLKHFLALADENKGMRNLPVGGRRSLLRACALATEDDGSVAKAGWHEEVAEDDGQPPGAAEVVHRPVHLEDGGKVGFTILCARGPINHMFAEVGVHT